MEYENWVFTPSAGAVPVTCSVLDARTTRWVLQKVTVCEKLKTLAESQLVDGYGIFSFSQNKYILLCENTSDNNWVKLATRRPTTTDADTAPINPPLLIIITSVISIGACRKRLLNTDLASLTAYFEQKLRY